MGVVIGDGRVVVDRLTYGRVVIHDRQSGDTVELSAVAVSDLRDLLDPDD